MIGPKGTSTAITETGVTAMMSGTSAQFADASHCVGVTGCYGVLRGPRTMPATIVMAAVVRAISATLKLGQCQPKA